MSINRILSIFLALFALSTVNNIFAKTNFVISIAVLTLFFAFLIYKIVKNQEKLSFH